MKGKYTVVLSVIVGVGIGGLAMHGLDPQITSRSRISYLMKCYANAVRKVSLRETA
jgi:hypothetical protein